MFIVKKFRRMIAAAVTAGALIFSPQVDSLNFMSVVRAESSQTNLAEQKFEEANKFYEQGKFAEAIELYTQAIELNPNFADAYKNRGAAYVDLRQSERGIVDLNKALELKPNDFEALKQKLKRLIRALKIR